jgi:hypothetical protein
MDAFETLRQDVQAGRVSLDRLVDLLGSEQRLLQAAHQSSRHGLWPTSTTEKPRNSHRSQSKIGKISRELRKLG